VDILIVISDYNTYVHIFPRLDNVNSFQHGLLYAMFGFKTTRVLKGIKLRSKFGRIPDAVNRYLAEIGLAAIIMVVFFACVMQFFEQFTQNYPFHTWLYYIFVTISSVGYGKTHFSFSFVFIFVKRSFVSFQR
jgi:fatty acid desaturase